MCLSVCEGVRVAGESLLPHNHHPLPTTIHEANQHLWWPTLGESLRCPLKTGLTITPCVCRSTPPPYIWREPTNLYFTDKSISVITGTNKACPLNLISSLFDVMEHILNCRHSERSESNSSPLRAGRNERTRPAVLFLPRAVSFGQAIALHESCDFKALLD